MKKKKINLLLLIIIGLIFSCSPEPGASVDYIIKNNTDSEIILHMIGYDNSVDTVDIDINESKIFHYYFEDQSVAPPPFVHSYIDTIIFIYRDSIQQIYHANLNGKNPFSLDSYTGGQTDYINGIYSYSYQYDILVEDF